MLIQKMEPISHGRTDLRKRKPKLLAVINENCTGCAGSPVCVDYCPVQACMFWIPDVDHPPFGRIQVDKATCIGCAKCTSKGPDGMFLDGCPWDAIDMVAIEEWEMVHGIQLPALPDRAANDWGYVPSEFV
jgi:ferredoxin